MRKIYVLTGLLICTSFVFAQKNNVKKYAKEKDVSVIKTPKAKKPNVNKNEIWSNDFSVASDWGISNNTNDNQDWVISTSTATNLGYGTGAWVDPNNEVSNENGYALYDSDFVGADGGNQDALLTYTGSIDCSGYPNVMLEFNQRVRMWQTTETIFEVSNDGGSTWIPFAVNGDKNISQLYQETSQVNISSAAGGQANVKIRLRYIGSWDYAWLVDDLKIIEQPANDIRSLAPFVAGSNNEGLEYGRTPIAHLDASYEIGGYAYNFGSSDATGVTGNADFGSFGYSYNVGTVVSGDTAIYGAPETPTLEIGLYEGTFIVTSNEEVDTLPTHANNKSLRNFEVTEKLYSLDGIDVYNEDLLALTSLGSNSFTTPTGTVFATMYHLRAGNNTINGVEIALASGSTANTEIQVAIIDTAELLADGIMPVTDANGVEALSAFYSISSSDLTNGVALVSFQSPIVLPDNAYYVAVLTSVDQSQVIRILDDQTVAQPWYASMIHLINDGGTYSNGNALGIRLKTQTVGLEESVGINLNVFPNPAQDVLTIASNVNSGSIVISDVSGKIVQVVTMQSSTSTLSTAGLENGIYYVTISNDNFSKTEKVVISK